jgi:hypothetical protein
MSKMEMKNEVELEEFTDELSDEALDREGDKYCGATLSGQTGNCRAGN